MNIRKIKGFCTAARCGSFSKAAESIFMTQSSFSRMISSIEEELGCTLFERGRVETVLTPIGREILPEMEAILEHYENAAHKASVYKPTSSGSIVVGEFGFGWSDPARKLSAEWNNSGHRAPVRVQEVTGTSAFTALRSGEIDFMHTIYIPTKYQPFLAAVPAEIFTNCALVSEGSPLSEHSEVSLKELKDEPFIFFDRSQFPLMYDTVVSACADEGFIPEVVFETSNISLMFNRVATGEGIAIIPNFIGKMPDGVAAVPVKELPPDQSYWFWWKENTRPEVLEFVDYLTEKFGKPVD